MFLKWLKNDQIAQRAVKLLGARHYSIEKHNFLEILDIQHSGSERCFHGSQPFFGRSLEGENWLRHRTMHILESNWDLGFASKIAHK